MIKQSGSIRMQTDPNFHPFPSLWTMSGSIADELAPVSANDDGNRVTFSGRSGDALRRDQEGDVEQPRDLLMTEASEDRAPDDDIDNDNDDDIDDDNDDGGYDGDEDINDGDADDGEDEEEDSDSGNEELRRSFHCRYIGSPFISFLLWIENWGAALFSPNIRNKFFAWLSVGAVMAAIIVAYVTLFRNDSSLSRLTLFLVLDSGTSFFAFLIILFGPIRYALSGLEFKSPHTSSWALSYSAYRYKHRKRGNKKRKAGHGNGNGGNGNGGGLNTESDASSAISDVGGEPFLPVAATNDNSTGALQKEDAGIPSETMPLVGSHPSAPTYSHAATRDNEHANPAHGDDQIEADIDISFLRNDMLINMNIVLFLICFALTCWKDYVRVDHDSGPDTSLTWKVIFVLSSLVEDTVFCGGFLMLAVAYRILALRVWRLRTRLLIAMERRIKHRQVHKQHRYLNAALRSHMFLDLPQSSSSSPPTAVAKERMLRQLHKEHERDKSQYHLFELIRARYESTFQAARSLSERTSLFTLLMISMILLQITSIGYDIIVSPSSDEDGWETPSTAASDATSNPVTSASFRKDYAHFQLLRMLLFLSIQLFQIVISAANLMFASRRLAERLVRVECLVREEIYEFEVQQLKMESSTAPTTAILTRTQRAVKQAQADLLKTLSYRVKNHPVRISWGWFNLTTGWSVGMSFIIATGILGFIGIQLPTGT